MDIMSWHSPDNKSVSTKLEHLWNNYAKMDMPVNVPVDNPNVDTEWYALVAYMGYSR